MLRPVTLEAVSDEMFRRREELGESVDKLGAAEAKDLVTKITGQFTEVQPIVSRQYPTKVRDADTQGEKAKKLLKILISDTVRSPGDAEKWQGAIEGR
jgi:hypothetical protein